MNFSETVKALSSLNDSSFYHYGVESVPFPSVTELKEIVEICRSLLFPGYFGKSIIDKDALLYHVGANVDRLYEKVAKQILAGLAFTSEDCGCTECRQMLNEAAHEKSAAFIESLPQLREILETDVVAHYRNDPAAHNAGEVILCYPGLRAICSHRLAHRFVELEVPLIPRIISEMAHGETCIDIHPAAQIGHSFTIDHGTGVVIGATAILGHNVTLYQGVTLGARNFPQEEDGSLVKGIARHPILGNGVVVYANATILGRVRIGDDAVIGGNLWITHDVEAGAKMFFKKKVLAEVDGALFI